MPTITIEALEKELKQGILHNCYVLYGEEKFLLESCFKKIKKAFGEVVPGINYIVIEENTIAELIPNLETPAFGYAKKMIVIKNTGLLKKEGKRKNPALADAREKLIKYLQQEQEMVLSYNVLVWVEEEIEKNSLYKQLEKMDATICPFEEQKLPAILARVKGICKAYGITADDSTLRYFLENCGTNMQEIINELRKVIEYAGKNGTIQKIDIDTLCNKKIEAVIFDVTDALGKKDTRKGNFGITTINIPERANS